jgi:hypothetical protein
MTVSQAGRDYGVGDLVWTVDPFKIGGDVSRMFAIVTTETHPFQGKQFVGVSLTTTDHLIGHPLSDEYSELGGTPEPSRILPLSIHSPRTSQIQAPPEYDSISDPWQGRLTDEFMKKVVDEILFAFNKDVARV